MALRDRYNIAQGGPDGQSTWYDDGVATVLQNHTSVTATTTLNSIPLGIVPTANKVTVGGNAVSDFVASGAAIQALYGAQVVLSAALAASTALTLSVSIYRAGAQLGGSAVLGWTAAGGGTPAFTAFTTVAMPWLTANTNVVVTGPGNFVLLQPSDALFLNLQTSAGTVAVPVGLVNTLIV